MTEQPVRPKLSATFRDNLITGAFVLAPIGAVAWISLWLWNVLEGVAGVIPASLHPKELLHIENPLAVNALDFLLTIFMFGLLLLLIWFVGLISRAYLGRQALSFIRSTVTRIPILKTVYSTLEQLLETFSGNSKTKSFSRVVRIEYPRKGIQTLALVTGENKGMLTVFVPTTPNPTSGFYLMLAAEEATDAGISVEEALKEIISMGLVKKEN